MIKCLLTAINCLINNKSIQINDLIQKGNVKLIGTNSDGEMELISDGSAEKEISCEEKCGFVLETSKNENMGKAKRKRDQEEDCHKIDVYAEINGTKNKEKDHEMISDEFFEENSESNHEENNEEDSEEESEEKSEEESKENHKENSEEESEQESENESEKKKREQFYQEYKK